MAGQSQLDCLLDLCRRLPPQRVEENLSLLVEICPEWADDLLSSVDQPLKVCVDAPSGREYLACDFNRDGDSYRSPWSSEYDPPLPDGTQPSPKLRKLEIAANEAFDIYREMYFEGGLSSVYLWDLDEGFAGVVLLKKTLPSSSAPEASRHGSWDSIHVFEASERGRSAHYKLTSTVMLHIIRRNGRVGEMELGGTMTRQTDQDAPLDPTLSSTHVSNIGKLIEDMEIKMRSLLQEVYGSKTKDIVNDLRSLNGMSEGKRRLAIQGELVGRLRAGSDR